MEFGAGAGGEELEPETGGKGPAAGADAIRAGLVCHEWHNIVSAPSFSKLCSRTLSGCSKVCFPAVFSRRSEPGLGLDVEQEFKRHKLPPLPSAAPLFRTLSVCVASHKGLLCLDLYKEIWVTNPVTGAVRGLPCFRSLIKGDGELSGRYSSSLSSAFLQVADDGQSYTSLGVCKRKAGGDSLAAGPARIVRYRSSSSSWTLLPSRCEEAGEGIDLTLCDLCCNCAFSDGQVFGLARDRAPGFSYFLVSFDVEAMRWKCVCKVEQDIQEPKQVVVCNSCIMVVVQSWEESCESWMIDKQPLFVVMRYDPAEKAMVRETQLPGIDDRGLEHFFTNGPLLCIIVREMATYNASTRKWRSNSKKRFEPWTIVNKSFTRGPFGSIFPRCAFELGLSTPI